MSGEDKKTSGKGELRGAPLDVVRELLGEGRTDDVLAVVAALVSRNRELELLLAKMRESRNRGEHISAEQLALFTKLLREQSGGALSEADRKLAEAAPQVRRKRTSHGGLLRRRLGLGPPAVLLRGFGKLAIRL